MGVCVLRSQQFIEPLPSAMWYVLGLGCTSSTLQLSESLVERLVSQKPYWPNLWGEQGISALGAHCHCCEERGSDSYVSCCCTQGQS
jgi:hypothetical protein